MRVTDKGEVAAPESYASQRAYAGIVRQADPTIVEEADEVVPAPEAVQRGLENSHHRNKNLPILMRLCE